MSEIESKLDELLKSISGGCPCSECRKKHTDLILALIAADRAGLVERIHELEQELNSRPNSITHDDSSIKHFSSGNAPEFDGIKHFQD